MFAFVFGWFFWIILNSFVQYGMESMMRGEMYPMNLNEQVIRPLLGNAGVIGLFLIPLITMRLFAEEKRSGTIELLVTSPIRDGEVIFGKWLAAVTMYAALLLLVALNFIFLFKYGNPDWKPLAIGYLGLLLQAAPLLAIGMFISTLTRNQIVAGGATFGLCLMFWVVGWVGVSGGGFSSDTWAQVVSYLSIPNHNESFAKGLLDAKDAIYFVTLTFVGIFLTARSLESLRWRS
jgi:ABC-2 type transport system permease protein